MSAKTTAAAVFAALTIVLQVPGGRAQTQEPAHQHEATAPAANNMPAHCQAMTAGHGTPNADRAAAHARLNGLVASMNAASGSAKVDAVAAVVAELAALEMRGGCEMMKH